MKQPPFVAKTAPRQEYAGNDNYHKDMDLEKIVPTESQTFKKYLRPYPHQGTVTGAPVLLLFVQTKTLIRK